MRYGILLVGLLLAGCESDEKKLARLQEARSRENTDVVIWSARVEKYPLPSDTIALGKLSKAYLDSALELRDSLHSHERRKTLAERDLNAFMSGR